MAYASVTYTSASGTTFALTNSNGDPIPYIRQSDIKVYVNNVLQTVTTDYTFNTAGTAIVLNSPVSGATVLLQRITDITDPTVVYTAGSTLTAQDLNNADNQIRYGLQEFQDSVNAGGGVPDGDKGDITVAGNGTIWAIDSGAVVEAKIASGAVTETKIGTGAVTSAKIANDTIVNADINSAAAIAHSKLASITAGSVLLGNSSNVPTATALTGDVTVDSSGVTAIGSGVVVDADINASAAIALSKLATGALPTAITVASANLVNGTIVDEDISASAEIAVSKLADGAARQLLQTDAAGTGVEWTSNVDIPGTLDVTGAAVFDSTAAVSGDVTIADKIIHAGDTDTAIRFPAADVVAVETSGSERCRVDSSGRLLVGTSSARTNVYGITPYFQTEGANGNNNRSTSVIYGENSDAGPLITFGKHRSASVGGNTAVINGDELGQVVFSGADGTNFVQAATIKVQVDGTPGANDMPGRLVFSTTADGASSPRERFIIPQSGALSFWAPNSAFNVSSGSGAGTSDSVFTGWYGGTGPGAATLGTISVRIWNNGNIVNQNNSYGSLSDLKLKENIVDASSQWDDIKALQVRKYNFKEGQTHTQIGLIAQEVELVSPGLVGESPDRDAEGNDLGTVTKSVNYSVLYMKAVKALQEAMERIETLEAKVAALEAV